MQNIKNTIKQTNMRSYLISVGAFTTAVVALHVEKEQMGLAQTDAEHTIQSGVPDPTFSQ